MSLFRNIRRKIKLSSIRTIKGKRLYPLTPPLTCFANTGARRENSSDVTAGDGRNAFVSCPSTKRPSRGARKTLVRVPDK